MKPLTVLFLVLAAVGVLLFAIWSLPSRKDGGGGGEVGPRPTTPALAPEAARGGSALPDAGSSGRGAAAAAAPASARSGAAGEGWANQLVGRVDSPEKQPLAGAQVVLTRSSSAASLFVNAEVDRSRDRRLRTGSDGRFSFENVEPYDHYAIEVYHPDYSRAEVVPVRVGMEGVFQEGPIVLTRGATLKGTVRAQDGGGIAGATLHLDSMFFQAKDEPNPDRLSVQSDGFGAYEFKNVAAGHRSLLVEADGFANALISNLNFRDQDAVERDVTLEVAEMICGRVVGPGNQPVAGAELQALSFSSGGQQCREITVSEEDGSFCFTSISPGRYLVAARAPGFQAANQRSVQSGDTNVLIEMKTQASVRGKVIDAATGQPITSFTASLRQTFDEVSATTPTATRGQFDDPEGEFELSGVAQGSYLVEAVAPGYAPGHSSSFVINPGQSAQGIVVRLDKGGAITGVIRNPEGAPVARARIFTKPNDWTGSEFDEALGDLLPSNVTLTETLSDADGHFRLENLRPDSYQVRVQAANLCEVILTDVVVPPTGEKSLNNVDMIAGGRIVGKVFDQAGRPVGNARVQMRIETGGGGRLPRFYNVKANAEGDYEIPNVHPGNYRIQAQPPRGASGDFLDLLSGGSQSRPVSAVDGRTVTVELQLGS